MKLLLVDDEEYVIESIKKHVDWKKCGVEELFTAFSMKQAQEVMELMPVDVIISDIVMPCGSGFDFIEWVREKEYEVQVIFLTSYAEFDYARKAISLDSVDYLLKPIDFRKLEKALEDAVKRASEAKKYEDYRRESLHWKENSLVIRRSFWHEVQKEHILQSDFVSEGKRRGLLYEEGQQFELIYFAFQEEKRRREQWDEKTLQFVVENVLTEILERNGICVEIVLSAGINSYEILCREENHREFQEEELRRKRILEQFISWMSEKTNLYIWCGAGHMESGTELPAVQAMIQVMRENSLSVWNRVLWISDFRQPAAAVVNPNLHFWETLMEEGKKAELISGMETYLTDMENREMITREILKSFRTDVMQMVYSWLARKEIKAHLLFSNGESEAFYQNALEGLHEALTFGRNLVDKAVEYETHVNGTASVSEQICDYIDKHYREDIRRDDLAELVFLNTDYMARIFKKEVGMSLSTYILQKRVDEARKLLSGSNLPINTVSLYVGYSNFSYFTKMFKDNTGYSPLEYRRIHAWPKGSSGHPESKN